MALDNNFFGQNWTYGHMKEEGTDVGNKMCCVERKITYINEPNLEGFLLAWALFVMELIPTLADANKRKGRKILLLSKESGRKLFRVLTDWSNTDSKCWRSRFGIAKALEQFGAIHCRCSPISLELDISSTIDERSPMLPIACESFTPLDSYWVKQ